LDYICVKPKHCFLSFCLWKVVQRFFSSHYFLWRSFVASSLQIKIFTSSLSLLFSFSFMKGTKFPIFIIPFGCPSQLGLIWWFLDDAAMEEGELWVLLYWVGFFLLGVDSFNISSKISLFPIFVLDWFLFFAFVFKVNWNSLFFFSELVVVVWFMLMIVSWDWDIICRIYELVMEHSLISIFSELWMKKYIQTLWINVEWPIIIDIVQILF